MAGRKIPGRKFFGKHIFDKCGDNLFILFFTKYFLFVFSLIGFLKMLTYNK